jgi:hypothetical protein
MPSADGFVISSNKVSRMLLLLLLWGGSRSDMTHIDRSTGNRQVLPPEQVDEFYHANALPQQNDPGISSGKKSNQG